MKSNAKLISMIAALLVGIAGVLGTLLIFVGGDQDSAVLTAVNVTIAILVVGIVLAVASALTGMFVNPAGLRNAIIGIAVLGLVVVVAFLTADGSDHAAYETTETTAYYVSAGLNTFYIIGLLTLLSVLYSAVARIIK